MLKRIFKELFDKLSHEPNINGASKNAKANYFVNEYLEKKLGKFNVLSPRTLKNYYEKYVEGKKNSSGEPRSEIKNLIAKYIGYNDFADFISQNTTPVEIVENNRTNKKSKGFKLVLGFILIIIGSSYYLISNKQQKNDCPVWMIDHYELVNCRNEDPNELLLDVNVKKFRKVTLNCDSKIFKNKHPLYWYGKSINGEFDFFNSRGIHPITLKDLKPITQYIFNKYVCEKEVD